MVFVLKGIHYLAYVCAYVSDMSVNVCFCLGSCVCLNYCHCLGMGDKDQGLKARMHSISGGLTVMHLLVSMEFHLFSYMLLSILVSFHWSLQGEALYSPDNCLASYLIYGCHYIWYVCVRQHKFPFKAC